MTEKNSLPQDEAKPVQGTTQTEEQKGENQADITTPLPVVQPDESGTQQPNSAETEEETDRKQDESIASLAEQTRWIKKQTDWIRYQVIASSLLGVATLGVLVYHGFILSQQQASMQDSVTKQTEAIGQTHTLIGQQQKALEYAETQAAAAKESARAATDAVGQNKELVTAAKTQADASLIQAKTSQKSARAAEESARIALIGSVPKIGAEPVLITFEASKEVKIGINIVNKGNTKASNLIAESHIFRFDPPWRRESWNPRALGSPSISDIEPQGVVNVSLIGKEVSPEEYEKIRSGQREMRVWLWGRYDDEFGGRARPYSFCWAYRLETGKLANCTQEQYSEHRPN